MKKFLLLALLMLFSLLAGNRMHSGPAGPHRHPGDLTSKGLRPEANVFTRSGVNDLANTS